jgi:gamma-glutamyltranspeptidase/glutathione hydrolase
MFRRRTSLLFLLAAFIVTACGGSINQAAIAMPDAYAAQASEDVLRAGGNAVDAAVAAGFVLAVTYPEAGNIGGGGFMLIHMDGESAFLDYRETAPLAAERDMYLDESGEVIEGSSLVGIRAVGVPGTVAGFWAAHRRFGSLEWDQLLQPAIDLATNGFPVSADLAARQAEYLPDLAGKTNFDRFFGGLNEGALFRQLQLAETLHRIAAAGRAGFYEGQTAQLTVDQMERSGGLIIAEDLSRYEAIWREPIRAGWRDYEVISAPPPSSGGFAIIQLLAIRDSLDRQFEDLAHNSPQYIHLVAEIEKRVFADRAEYLGDPDFVAVPIDELLDADYLASRAEQIDPEHISSLQAVPPGLGSANTTHYSIVDRWGNAVSNTYTLNDWFGSGIVVEGAGYILNGEMDDFSIKPGAPNLYGVVGDRANEIQAGKRPLSSMSPTMLLRDGEVALVVGTPGGSTIFTSVFQTIVNIVDFSMSPEDAVGATRFHHQLLPPDLVTYSPGRPLPVDTIAALAERGYRAEPHSWEFGDVQVILRQGDELQPASDPRHRGESRIVTH